MERFAATGGDTLLSVSLDAFATKMDVGLLLLNAAGQPEYSSRVANELLGCPDSDALAAQWAVLRRLLLLDDNAFLENPARRCFAVDLALGGGTRFLRVEVRPMPLGFEVLLKDRRTLSDLDSELIGASRMREWMPQCETLLHDANGALNTIQLTLELLDGQWPGERAGEQVRDPQRRSHVTVIRDNLEKLKGTLRPLSDGQDDAPAKAASFDLRDAISGTASVLKMPARRRRIELKIRTPEQPLPVFGQRERIRQALVNVVLSRLESLPEHSRLLVECRAAADGVVEWECTDDGPPMPEEIKLRIFQVLFVAGGGSGGCADTLRLTRAIVECEGGELQVRDLAGQGTAIVIGFPRGVPA